MKFIMAIVVIALSGATVCSQDFGSYMTRTANTNNDRPQSDSSTYLPTFNTQQPLEKLQIFQTATNSQQNNVMSYRVQRPSVFYIPSKIGSSAYGQSSFTPYSISKLINSQQYFSRHMRQGFRSFASYNPRLNQFSYSSVSLPTDIPKSSSTHLSPPPALFPSTSPRPFRSASRIRRQLVKHIGGNEFISIDKDPTTPLPPPKALSEIYDTNDCDDDGWFGRKHILLFRDLLQLFPVHEVLPFVYLSHERIKICFVSLSATNLWITLFHYDELTINMRQTGDGFYRELLSRIRIGLLIESDNQLPENRKIFFTDDSFERRLNELYDFINDLSSDLTPFVYWLPAVMFLMLQC